MATTALDEEKRKAIGYSFPQNVPEGGSIYRKRPLASDAAPVQPQGMAILKADTQTGASQSQRGEGFVPAAPSRPLVDQIPTGGPAGWTGGNRELVQPQSDLSRNIQNTAVALSGLPGVGPIASLAGQSGRMATGLAGLTRAGQAANAAVQTANGITSMQPSAVAEQVANAPAAEKPLAMGASLVTASQSQRGEGGIPGIPAPTTPAAPTTTNQGLGIVRVDAPGASPLFTNLPTNDPSNVGLMARRAAPSAQNVGAMDALAGRYEANTTAQAQAMINAEQAAATRMTPGQQYIQQAMNAPRTFKNLNQRQLARIYDQGNRMDSDAARLGADKARMGLDAFKYQDEASTNDLRRKSVQSELDTKAQLDAARQEYLAAGDDPDKQKAAAKKLAVLSGKDGKSDNLKENFIVVGGGQEYDQASGTMRNVPQTLVDLRTSQPVALPAQQAQAKTAATGQKYAVGQTVVKPDGSRGRVVAIDANGMATEIQPL